MKSLLALFLAMPLMAADTILYHGVKDVGIRDGINLDAFSRLRVSQPEYLFSVIHDYSTASLLMEGGASGTGVAPVFNPSNHMVELTAAAGSGVVYHQSYEYIEYQPGKSQLILITGNHGDGVSGAVSDVGLFDSDNGLIYRQNGVSGMQFIRRSKTTGVVSNEAINQSGWNLDKLDGTGASGVVLASNKVFILVIDAQYLGMGRVRMGFDLGGQIVYCHQFLHANILAEPYMQMLSLPIQMLLTATATGSSKTSAFKCAAVNSEGGFSGGIAYTFSTPLMSATATNGVATSLVSMRPLVLWKGLTNRMAMGFESVEILVTGNYPVMWEISTAAAFSTSPTWSSVDTNSASEYTSANGVISTNGYVIARGFCAASATVRGTSTATRRFRRPITLNRAGAQTASGTLTLSVRGVGGNSECYGILNFYEIR